MGKQHIQSSAGHSALLNCGVHKHPLLIIVTTVPPCSSHLSNHVTFLWTSHQHHLLILFESRNHISPASHRPTVAEGGFDLLTSTSQVLELSLCHHAQFYMVLRQVLYRLSYIPSPCNTILSRSLKVVRHHIFH